jgi:hypothetical protein
MRSQRTYRIQGKNGIDIEKRLPSREHLLVRQLQNTHCDTDSTLENRVDNNENNIGLNRSDITRLQADVNALKLQHSYPPYPYPPPPPFPYYPLLPTQPFPGFREEARSSMNRHLDGEQARHENAHIGTENAHHLYPQNYQIPRRPVIIFDGYRSYYDPLTQHWYVEPESSAHTDVYRFRYNSTSNVQKYVYEQVDPSNRIVVLPSTQNQPHLYYTFVPEYGWSLCNVDITFDADVSPHTINGYEYKQTTSYGWCYVPVSGPAANNGTTASYDKIIVFGFTYYNPYITTGYYPFYYNNGVTTTWQYPYALREVSTAHIIPLTNNGVGYLLPDNSEVKELILQAKLRIHKAAIRNLSNDNVYPDGSSNPFEFGYGGDNTLSLTPCAEIVYLVVSDTGVVQETTTIGKVTFTQESLETEDGNSNKLKLYEDTYFQTKDLLVAPDFNLLPASSPNGRRVITIRASSTFSFVYAKITCK